MKIIFRFLFIMSILLIIGCEEYKIVARVGNEPIYVKDFKNVFLKEYPLTSNEKVSEQKKNNILNTMIEEKVQLLDAYRNNLESDSNIIAFTKRNETRFVYETVLNTQIVNKLISEKEYKDRYDKISREVKVLHIFIPYPKSRNEEEKNNIINKLDSLRYLILRGEEFGLLARQFSKDSLSAGKGGDLGFIKWDDKKYNDVFYNQIFKIKKGNVSKVFETDKGYHLVKIQQTRPVPVESYDRQKPLILKTFFREKAKELNKGFYEFMDKLKKMYPVKFYEENIKYFVDFVQHEIDSLNKEGEGFSLNKSLNSIDADLPLFEFKMKKYSIKQFIDDLNSMYPLYYPDIYSFGKINDNLKRLANRELMVYFGYKHGYHKKQQVRANILKQKEELMIKAINNLKVNKSITENEIKEYYEKNMDVYSKPNKYKVQEIRVKDEELIQTIYKDAKKNVNFESLVLKYNENKETKNKNGVLGYITAKQYGVIGSTAATLKIGEISKPIEGDGFYSIIKILDIVEGEQKPFNELNRNLIMTLKKAMIKEKKENWLKELDVQYPVIKYEAVLNNVFKEKEII